MGDGWGIAAARHTARERLAFSALRIFRPAVQASGISDWEHHTPRSFRHGAVVTSIAVGITDGDKISRSLGHGTPVSTHRPYRQLLPDDEPEVTPWRSAARGEGRGGGEGVGKVRMVRG